VPIICDAGDVVICNRQLVHGSFPNSGFEPRVTVNFGFHRRSSVLGVKGAGIHNDVMTYDADLIEHRSRVIAYAIDARSKRYPQEVPYQYQPFVESGKEYMWTEEAKAGLKDYNLHDLSI
jgi:ectoine hydroxylase-related dioxygenase (phytanoyl-CoA dioxygenase family)